jgi:hypothetical protein
MLIWICFVSLIRVPCEYKNQNLAVRVEESSKNSNYLAIKLLYQGGQTEVVAIDFAKVSFNLPQWSILRHHLVSGCFLKFFLF